MTQKQYYISDSAITLKHLCHHGHDRITRHSYPPAVLRYLDNHCAIRFIHTGLNNQYLLKIFGHPSPKAIMRYTHWSGKDIHNSTSPLYDPDIGLVRNYITGNILYSLVMRTKYSYINKFMLPYYLRSIAARMGSFCKIN